MPTLVAPAEKREPPHRQDKTKAGVDWFRVFAAVAILLQSGLLFLALFEPGLPYIVSSPPASALDSERFFQTLVALTGAQAGNASAPQVLANGEQYYTAQLHAMAKAKSSICLEAYIFGGEVGRRFIDALVERAREGVDVRLVVDAVGSASLSPKEIQRLQDAGGNFAWYLPLRWYTWPRVNNRTHRELLIIDGKVAFVGGAGWDDHWLSETSGDEPRWRDTMVKVEGSIVTGLQGAFAENWLEASGEVLTTREHFPFEPNTAGSPALVVRSAPTSGRSTPARVLFQLLLASARKRIYITTPYFLPDASIRDEIARAIHERGVEVKIITPGPGTDHMLTRRSSRRLFGDLLRAGAQIYEYQPSMIHAKTLVVDSLWVVVGSTNMDPRSFSLNDEVNLATPNPHMARRLEQDFHEDLKHSHAVTYQEWKNRGIAERLHEWLGAPLQRQQ